MTAAEHSSVGVAPALPCWDAEPAWGWDGERKRKRECCLRLSGVPLLKKNPKVITRPCKFALFWRSFEVAAVSEALGAELVCSW